MKCTATAWAWTCETTQRGTVAFLDDELEPIVEREFPGLGRERRPLNALVSVIP